MQSNPINPTRNSVSDARRVLTYDARSETIEEKQINDKWEDQN